MATIRFAEGTSYRVEYTLYDENNNSITLTGAKLTFAAYRPGSSKTGSVTPFLYKEIGNGIDIYTDTTVDPVVQRVILTFYPSETEDKAGVYEWELELVEINNDVWLAGSGPLVIQPGRRLDK